MHRRDIDDAAATALFDHLLGGELGAKKGTLEVHIENLVVILWAGVKHRGARFQASVVHHDVEPAVARNGLINHGLQLIEMGDIGLSTHGLTTSGLDGADHLVGALGMGAVIDDNFGAALG